MRRKAKSEARTTLLIPERKIWAWAKGKASGLGYASTSEYLFDLLQKEQARQEWEPLLRALERRLELGHYTIGRCADEAVIPRIEVAKFLEHLGLPHQLPPSEHALEVLHDLLLRHGVPRREEVIVRNLAGSRDRGIRLSSSCFEDPSQFASELLLQYGLLLEQVGHDGRLRKALDALIEAAGSKRLAAVIPLLISARDSHELHGPTDWRGAILYWSALRSFASQWRLLGPAAHGGSSAGLLEILTQRAISLFADVEVFWGSAYRRPEFLLLRDVLLRGVTGAIELPWPESDSDPNRPGTGTWRRESSFAELSSPAFATADLLGTEPLTDGPLGFATFPPLATQGELQQFASSARARGMRVRVEKIVIDMVADESAVPSR